ncbi:MAG: S-layer homology domain-containing protein, partial [Clostridia bacterium]|nr:S-layer homology domain-containing protein [Clostridia bacterium]
LFDPDRNITRAEFAAIIARALKLSDKKADYKDVNDEWFAPYVGACSEAGIISGYDGMFRPNDNITRQEMAVIIVNAYSYLEKAGANGGIDNFTDKAEIADWAKAAVDTASSVGLISGMGDGTFAPSANATRAQAASIVKRLLDK